LEIKQVSLDDFEPAGAHVTFWTYYRTLLKDAAGSLPKRTDFDPLKIASVLHTMALSQYVDENTQTVRLIGGGHDSLWPSSMTGANLFDHIDEATAAARKIAYKEIVSRPCGCLIEEEAADKTGHILIYSGLILPTLSKDGSPTVFLGSYDFAADELEMRLSGEAGISARTTKSLTYIDLALAD